MKQEVKKEVRKAVDEEREKMEKRDLDRARKLYATGKHKASEVAELFDLNVAEILED